MSEIWFTADTHFGHTKIIQHSKRPFATVDEMDERLIEHYNAVVKSGDEVWHLGDFAYRNEKPASYYLSRLSVVPNIVWGNHDKGNYKHGHLFRSRQDVKYLKVNNEQITLYHYAQRVWRNSHHGSWHLFGHSHGSLPNYHRSMDVGVDAQNYRPISFGEVKTYMDQQVVTNHHPELLTDPWDKSETCRTCMGFGFVAQKRSIDDGYGEVDSCPDCGANRG